MSIDHDKPMVTHTGLLDMQVCVPEGWTDNEAHDFASRENPCGTFNGWAMRKNGDEALGGCDERVPCVERAGFVHIMFDA